MICLCLIIYSLCYAAKSSYRRVQDCVVQVDVVQLNVHLIPVVLQLDGNLANKLGWRCFQRTDTQTDAQMANAAKTIPAFPAFIGWRASKNRYNYRSEQLRQKYAKETRVGKFLPAAV